MKNSTRLLYLLLLCCFSLATMWAMELPPQPPRKPSARSEQSSKPKKSRRIARSLPVNDADFEDAVKSDLDKGKDKDSSERKRKNCANGQLHEAVRDGKLGKIERMLASGQHTVDEKNKHDNSPLFNAVQTGQARLITLLIEKYHANPCVAAWDGEDTLIDIALQRGNGDTTAQLITGYILAKDPEFLEKTNGRGRLPLCNAIRANHTDYINFLLALPDTSFIRARERGDKNGDNTALDIAVQRNKPEIAEFLRALSGGPQAEAAPALRMAQLIPRPILPPAQVPRCPRGRPVLQPAVLPNIQDRPVCIQAPARQTSSHDWKKIVAGTVACAGLMYLIYLVGFTKKTATNKHNQQANPAQEILQA